MDLHCRDYCRLWYILIAVFNYSAAYACSPITPYTTFGYNPRFNSQYFPEHHRIIFECVDFDSSANLLLAYF